MTIVLFLCLPLLLGQLWKNVLSFESLIFTYLSGFMTLLAVFELLSIPMVLRFVPLHVQIPIYSFALGLLSGIVLIYCVYTKNHPKFPNLKTFFSGFSKYTWIYFILLLGLILFEVYFAITHDIGTWRSDDGIYTVISTTAIRDDGFYLTNIISSGYDPKIDAKYALSGIYVFYTYISVITGLGVAVIQHTICTVLFLLMSYGAFFLLSKILFVKDDDTENRLIFLIFLSLVFLFGMHSHYSVTFRLFGVVWQGKALLAVLFVPFLLATYSDYLWKKQSRKSLLFFIVVSMAAVSLTLGGTLAIVAIPGVLTALYIVSNKSLKPLLSLIAVNLFSAICIALYYVLK